MTLKELLDAVYNSNIENEAQAELGDIISAYQGMTDEPWEGEGEES